MRYYILILCIGAVFFLGHSQRTVSALFGDSASRDFIRIQMTLSDSVCLKIEGPASQWFALGFNTKRMQRGVDVCMVPAWKEAFTQLTPYDAVLTGYSPPKRDAIQDWKVSAEEMANGRRSFTLMRALTTNDLEDYDFSTLSKNGGPLDVIWAMGSEKGGQTEYHGNQKGKKVIRF